MIIENNNFRSIEEITKESILLLYKLNLKKSEIIFQYTKKNHEGDITLILFPLSKKLKISTEKIGKEIGLFVQKKLKKTIDFTIKKGFLNFIFRDKYYLYILKNMATLYYHEMNLSSDKIIIEYSSPNANKPLHLGHLRNILIGSSISEILKLIGCKIKKVQIINDRGIHICKSMISWKKFGKGDTPEKKKMKGDHFVGEYYKLFEKVFNEEKYSKKFSIMDDARKLLKKWEMGDAMVINIWKKMNLWVLKGFEETYNALGIKFDKTEYESDIYNIGKNIIKKGLKNGFFFKKKDGSIWINLNEKKISQKLLLRSDNTSVYITQDIGNAINRFKIYDIDKIIYVVGKEQDDHFDILFKILNILEYKWVKNLYHLSYEMVFLPCGKMNSRKGNVINIDNIISEMTHIAKRIFMKKSLEKKRRNYFEKIGIIALKYYFLQIDPKKKIIFDKKKSIDFRGKTGIYIQYTYSRIRSLEKKFFRSCFLKNFNLDDIKLGCYEKYVIKIIQKYPLIIKKSAFKLNPSIIANYIYEVSKTFNNLYQNKKLIIPSNAILSNFHMSIINVTGNVIKSGMNLLGIELMEKI